MWGFIDPVANTFVHQLYADVMLHAKLTAPEKTPHQIAESIREEMEEAALLVEHGSNDLDNERPGLIFSSRETLFTPAELNYIHLGPGFEAEAGNDLSDLADDFGLANLEHGGSELVPQVLRYEDAGEADHDTVPLDATFKTKEIATRSSKLAKLGLTQTLKKLINDSAEGGSMQVMVPLNTYLHLARRAGDSHKSRMSRDIGALRKLIYDALPEYSAYIVESEESAKLRAELDEAEVTHRLKEFQESEQFLLIPQAEVAQAVVQKRE